MSHSFVMQRDSNELFTETLFNFSRTFEETSDTGNLLKEIVFVVYLKYVWLQLYSCSFSLLIDLLVA